ncbi:tRNA-specific adenosine deaminase 2 [Trichoplax sp. H2]|nr:tRNA-specific adenosine deaminase 2 [Trichoplax sp. H2]|eukprot:RDD38406.1 tRNA-specific adenosine deaminase 2 [Trichoplax sp. H2]
MATTGSNSNEWMEIAFELANEALVAGEVPVGCVLVFGNKIIGKGRNEVNEVKNATRHAEMVAIEEAYKWCENNQVRPSVAFSNSQLLVTVEPCIMCSMALRYLRILLYMKIT